MSRTARRVPILLFLGALLMQAAWILAVPPFRGIDEFDHAYRAAAVARGQWTADEPAEHGRGQLVTVPRDIVEAAGPECRALPYPGPDNCNPVADLGDGMVTVASAAAQYNPVFYWVMGTPARLFHGAQALYAMRVVAAALCAAFLGLAGWAVGRWARTRWPLVALLVAATPVLVYSTAVAAPNGIEMTAALSVWAALLGLGRPGVCARTERSLLWAALPGGVVLATVRYMGPVWLLLLVLTVTAVAGMRAVAGVIARHRRLVGGLTTVITGATLTNVWWTLTDASSPLHGESRAVLTVADTVHLVFLWLLQTVAAFPTRDEQAPMVVYAAGGIALLALCVAGFWLARPRLRAVLVAGLVVAVLVPVVFTVVTYPTQGALWQGRYELSFTVGLVLLAGVALDRRPPHTHLRGPVLLAGGLALVVAHVVSVTHVLVGERANSPSAGSPAWPMPEPWVVALLMVLGWVAWVATLRGRFTVTGAEPTGQARTGTGRHRSDLVADPPGDGQRPASVGSAAAAP